MPFSATDCCTEDEWAQIFEELIRPAVEEAGLGFSCYRSTATRGNIVAAIMESLRDAYVVIADLTDQNPNVFYELGVRHSLRDRTILIAQDRNFIPFDLGAYANHIYDWKSDAGRDEFGVRIKALLEEIDENPDRPDNPVSDFLKSRAAPPSPQPEAPVVAPAEAAFAQPLTGSASDGLDTQRLAQAVVAAASPVQMRTIVRLTRAFLNTAWPTRIAEVNAEAKPARIAREHIVESCLPHIEPFERDVLLIEEFGLALVEAEYLPGIDELMRLIEDWISLSERVWPGSSLRPTTGAPSLLALRLVMNWCAKAADILSVGAMQTLLIRPLATVEGTDRPIILPFADRRDLFWPAALLDYADKAVEYLTTQSWKNPGLRQMFAGEDEYTNGLSVALFVTGLIHHSRNPDAQLLYPGFKLIPGSSAAIEHFLSKIAPSEGALTAVASMANESLADFRQKWGERVAALNEASLGGRHDIWIDWTDIRSSI